MSQNTQGPWYAVWNGYFWDIQLSDELHAHSFASIHNNDSLGIGQEEAETNARLIAAAPELLEALQRITTEAKLDGLDKQPGWDCWVSLADKVIAKAEGRLSPITPVTGDTEKSHG